MEGVGRERQLNLPQFRQRQRDIFSVFYRTRRRHVLSMTQRFRKSSIYCYHYRLSTPWLSRRILTKWMYHQCGRRGFDPRKDLVRFHL